MDIRRSLTAINLAGRFLLGRPTEWDYLIDQIEMYGPKEVSSRLTAVSRVIGEEDFRLAHQILDEIICLVGENNPEVIRISMFLSLLEKTESASTR